MVVLSIVPEPVVPSSGALNEPDSVPMLTPLVVPWPAAVMDEPEAERVAAGLRKEADKASREARRARAKADDALGALRRLSEPT